MKVSVRICAVIAGSLLVSTSVQPGSADVADASSEAAILVGDWDCSGAVPGTTSQVTYRRVTATSMAVNSVVHTTNGTTGLRKETLTYDRADGVWQLRGQNEASDTERLTAPAWGAGNWTFNGTETARGSSHPVRIVYSYVPPDSFVRDHVTLISGRSNVDATTVCRRAPLEARYDGDWAPPPAGVHDRSTAEPELKPALAVTPPPEKNGTTTADRAYDLTHGVWDCKTFGGVDATHTYTRNADGSIALHNVLTIAKHSYAIDESYRFDSVKNTWTVLTSGDAYTGTAGKWSTDTWTFVGDMPIEGRRVPVRMIYSRLGDRAFRRDFIRIASGQTAPFAAETCQQR